MTNILILISIGILGWLVGVLVNYLSDILPIKRHLGTPICAACHDPMDFTNYIFWPRRCPECRQHKVKLGEADGAPRNERRSQKRARRMEE